MTQLEIGDRIGPYEIRECLGEGGMAAVYKAWHTGLHRFEALKIPLAKGGTPDAAFVQRLLAEARTAASLHHPHIVGIHNVSEPTAPQPFFAMDFIAGSDLAKILAERGRFSAGEAIQILEPVAAALDHAHAAGIIHRDVKPANILLTRKDDENWAAKVVDFGISRAAEDDDVGATKLTKSGMIVGTPEYMSPEQSGSGEPVDFRTDIYSLAIVAYEMLCGGPPFTAGQGVSRLAILIKHVRDEPQIPAVHCAGISAAVSEVILKGLQKHPANRFQSCSAFAAAFGEAVEASGDAAWVAGTTPFDAARVAPVDTATVMERPGVGGNRTLPLQPGGEKTAVLEVAPPALAAGALDVLSEPVFAPKIEHPTLPTAVSAPRRASRAPLWAALGGVRTFRLRADGRRRNAGNEAQNCRRSARRAKTGCTRRCDGHSSRAKAAPRFPQKPRGTPAEIAEHPF